MKYLFVLLLISLTIITGCGGSSTGINPGTTPIMTQGILKGYIYGPSVSSLRSERGQGLNREEGLIVIDEISQVPPGYTPVVNCTVKLIDGPSTETDNRGWFAFSGLNPGNYGQNSTIILDPAGSSSHSGFGSVTIETIIPGDNPPPPDLSEIIIKPQNLILPLGGFFLYHAYGMSGNGEVFRIPQEQVEWFVNSSEGNIGSITPFGLFEASGTGSGRVLAKIKTPSGEKTATGTVQVLPQGPVSTIKGQVYRLSSAGTKEGLEGIQLFVSTRNPETVPGKPPQGVSDSNSTVPVPGNYYDIGTVTDREGFYEFPRIPAGENLTVTAVDPLNGFIKFIENITLSEGEIKVIDIDFSDSQNFFQGSGNLTYDGINFIFQSYGQPVPFPGETPIPLRSEALQGQGEPSVISTTLPEAEKFILLGMEKFPEIRDKIMKEQGKGFEAHVTGKTGDSQGIMKTIVVEHIELMAEPVYEGTGHAKYENNSFIFQINFDTPVANDEGNSSPPSPPEPQKFLLKGMDKFPSVRDTLMKEEGKEFYVYISGKINYSSGIIEVDRIEIIKDSEMFFQGSGTVKYANLEGGAFIFTESLPAPMPVIDGGGTAQTPPAPRSFVLYNMDKFPEIKDQIIKNQGHELLCFIAGEISQEPSIYMMDGIKVSRIELFISPGPIKQ